VRSLGGNFEQEDTNAGSNEEIRNDICCMAEPPPLHGNREMLIKYQVSLFTGAIGDTK
jgi:hypothetical protein